MCWEMQLFFCFLKLISGRAYPQTLLEGLHAPLSILYDIHYMISFEKLIFGVFYLISFLVWTRKTTSWWSLPIYSFSQHWRHFFSIEHPLTTPWALGRLAALLGAKNVDLVFNIDCWIFPGLKDISPGFWNLGLAALPCIWLGI